MKPFNLEQALAGAPVVTRDGRNASNFKFMGEVEEKPATTKKPHVHAELIKACADGEAIEVAATSNGVWVEVSKPGGLESSIYRIKPDTKPNVVGYARIGNFCDYEMETLCTKEQDDDVKIIFDGETGEPKSVELIKGAE